MIWIHTHNYNYTIYIFDLYVHCGQQTERKRKKNMRKRRSIFNGLKKEALRFFFYMSLKKQGKMHPFIRTFKQILCVGWEEKSLFRKSTIFRSNFFFFVNFSPFLNFDNTQQINRKNQLIQKQSNEQSKMYIQQCQATTSLAMLNEMLQCKNTHNKNQ